MNSPYPNSQSIRERLLAKKLEIEAKLAGSGVQTTVTPSTGSSSSFSVCAKAERGSGTEPFHRQGGSSTSSEKISEGTDDSNPPNSDGLSEIKRRIIDALAQQMVSQGTFSPSVDRTETELCEFLKQPSNADSVEWRYYQQRLEELRAQSSASSAQKAKKRSSRWGPPPEETPAVTSGAKPIPCPLSDDQLHGMHLAHLRQQLAAKDTVLKTKKVVLEDSLGQPSQEHLMRAAEMAKTKEHAVQLTKPLHEGKHHLQDFLPKEELAKFHQKTKGETGSEAEYEDNKLTEDNVGFQMLKKFGWTEGQGLGASSSGIAAPISSTPTMERAGLGVKRPDEPSEEDDEFSLYRKRMMLAYKYRPNPLNNPRRPYY